MSLICPCTGARGLGLDTCRRKPLSFAVCLLKKISAQCLKLLNLTVTDPIAIGDIRDLVAHLKDRGIGVLITDHNVRETLELIDRAVIIHDGQVLMEGHPSEIVGNEDVRRLYLGDRFSL